MSFSDLLAWYRSAREQHQVREARDLIERLQRRFTSNGILNDYTFRLKYCNCCEKALISDCENCGYCTNNNCCECSWCGSGEHRYNPEEYQDCCNSCRNCCECSTSSDIFFSSPLTFHNSPKHLNKENKSTRFISAEIEVANTTDQPQAIRSMVSKWKGSIVEDGSIDTGEGFEINTAPANGDAFIKQISDICGAFKEVEASVNESCGLHFHIDARDFDYFDIERLILLYSNVEPVLFSMVPPHRARNHYCVPSGAILNSQALKAAKPNDKRHVILKSLYGRLDKNLIGKKKDKYGTTRYRAMNLHSWFYRKTIEFRFPNSTVYKENIIGWGLLFASLLDAAKGRTKKEIETYPTGTAGSLSTLKRIAPSNIHSWIDKRIEMFKHEYGR